MAKEDSIYFKEFYKNAMANPSFVKLLNGIMKYEAGVTAEGKNIDIGTVQMPYINDDGLGVVSTATGLFQIVNGTWAKAEEVLPGVQLDPGGSLEEQYKTAVALIYSQLIRNDVAPDQIVNYGSEFNPQNPEKASFGKIIKAARSDWSFVNADFYSNIGEDVSDKEYTSETHEIVDNYSENNATRNETLKSWVDNEQPTLINNNKVTVADQNTFKYFAFEGTYDEETVKDLPVQEDKITATVDEYKASDKYNLKKSEEKPKTKKENLQDGLKSANDKLESANNVNENEPDLNENDSNDDEPNFREFKYNPKDQSIVDKLGGVNTLMGIAQAAAGAQSLGEEPSYDMVQGVAQGLMEQARVLEEIDRIGGMTPSEKVMMKRKVNSSVNELLYNSSKTANSMNASSIMGEATRTRHLGEQNIAAIGMQRKDAARKELGNVLMFLDERRRSPLMAKAEFDAQLSMQKAQLGAGALASGFNTVMQSISNAKEFGPGSLYDMRKQKLMFDMGLEDPEKTEEEFNKADKEKSEAEATEIKDLFTYEN